MDGTVIFPDQTGEIDQDQECIIWVRQGGEEKIRLHDYRRLYEIPGLYHHLIYERLQCRSPQMLAEMLSRTVRQAGENPHELRVLDFGAGDGAGGRELRKRAACEMLVGIDIIPEAKAAAERENPGVYDFYYVMDLLNMDARDRQRIRSLGLNCLFVAGALGFDDIQGGAFRNAFNMLLPHAWVIFNIKDAFTSGKTESGFGDVLQSMESGGCLSVSQKSRHFHRFSLAGKSIYYHAVVGRKCGEI